MSITASHSQYVQHVSYRSAKLFAGKRPLVSWLDIELTERCNNACVHCYINRPQHDRQALAKEIATQAVEQALTEAAALGCLRVRFTGGEPLLRPDFEQLYCFARRLGMTVVLFTNGTLITPALARLFADMPPREKIEITLYGMTQTTYEAVSRSPGTFAAAMRGVELLRRHAVPFIVKGVWLPANRQDTVLLERLAAAIPWMEGRPPSLTSNLTFRARNDVLDRNANIQRLRPPVEEVVAIMARQGQAYVAEMRQFCAKFVRPPGDLLFSCGAGVGNACLDAYGKLQSCLLLRHPDTVYALASGSLRDAMTVFFPRMRGLRATNPDYLSRCAHCFLQGLCEQCPGQSWMEHGTLDTPVEYLCQVAQAQARQLGLLQNGENAWEVENWEKRIADFVGSND